MNAPAIFFYLFAGLALATAVLVIFQKNPVTSALNLVLTFFALSGLYVLLEAHLVAALQIFVYAGAIMVLFVFVIMLLNADSPSFDLKRTPLAIRIASIAMGFAIFLGLVWVFHNSANSVIPGRFSNEAVAQAGGNSKVLSQAMFSQYLLPFELTSALLLAAIVGAVALSKRKPRVAAKGAAKKDHR